MRTGFAAIALLAGLAAAMPALAEYPWVVLAQRDVNSGSGDRQVIGVTGDRRFFAMRVCVTRQPIRIHDVAVRFREGASRTFQIGGVLANQRCTGEIALPANGGPLAEVAISYNSAGLSARGARLQLHAR